MNFSKKFIPLFYVVLFITLIGLVVINFSDIRAKYSDDCLVCHSDKDLTMEKNGKKISLFVDGSHYKNSVHGGLDCKDCHVNYNQDDIPHNPKSKGVDCKSCHDNVKSAENWVHKNVQCSDCHSRHSIQPAKEFSKNKDFCFTCHTSKNVTSFKQSKHIRSNIDCSNCHKGGHQTAKISKSASTQVCASCHKQASNQVVNSVHKIAYGKGTPVCVDCHGSHNPLGSRLLIQEQKCVKCHFDEKKFPGSEKGSAAFVKQYQKSIHGMSSKNGKLAATCADCHGDHMIQTLEKPNATLNKANIMNTCGKCHKEVVDKFKTSQHGVELLKGNEKAPVCTDCHGEHSIHSVDSDSSFTKLNQTDLCIKCHDGQKLPHKNNKGEEVSINNYKESYHYKALKEGKNNAATCSDCHGSHEMKKASDPTSRVFIRNIPTTCGQSKCHTKQLGEYKGSIHESAITQKNSLDAPVCTSCHGNHQVMNKSESNNLISNSKGLVQLCSSCHNSVEITTKNNLPLGKTESFMNSYHGLAVRSGSKLAANCESCHGYHNVRPSSDSLSTINPKNLPQTCGKCHQGVEKTFFDSKIHYTEDSKEGSPVLYWLSRFYVGMIVVVIGGMMFHNILDLRKKLKNKKSGKH